MQNQTYNIIKITVWDKMKQTVYNNEDISDTAALWNYFKTDTKNSSVSQ